MSETPKFEVIDRRKIKAEEEQETRASQPVDRPRRQRAGLWAAPRGQRAQTGIRRQLTPVSLEQNKDSLSCPPRQPLRRAPAENRLRCIRPTAGRSGSGAEPAMGSQPKIGFEHLVQQFYVSAMIQMGAGAQEGQRPRVDILGARTYHRPAGRTRGEDQRQPD